MNLGLSFRVGSKFVRILKRFARSFHKSESLFTNLLIAYIKIIQDLG
jgi:hypothetical protein